MKECKICYDIVDHEKFKQIPCGHEICQKCYINLLICECPFCRAKITYNNEDKKTRQSLGISNNADFSDNIVYNPRDFIYGNNINNQRNISSTTFRESNRINDVHDDPNYILSRTSRRRTRRIMQQQVAVTNTQEQANERRRKRSNRRRKLTDEEIRLKRENINKRKQLSRMKKHGRLMKEIAWYNLQID